MFKLAEGDLMGLPTSDKHINLEWLGEGRILFSITRLGNAVSAHYASDKKGLRYIKQAIEDCVKFVRINFDWCVMALAFLTKESAERILKKCGFNKIGTCRNNEVSIYMRVL